MRRVYMPGKVLLAGEHAVVYGYPGVVASVDRGVEVTVARGSGRVDLIRGVDAAGVVRRALEVSGLDTSRVDVRVRSEIPIGSGMGSSAAVAAALIRGLWEYSGRKYSLDSLFEKTMKCEKVAHSNPSGIDPAAVIYGGVLRYVKGKKPDKLHMDRKYTLFLVQTGRPDENTGTMIAKVVQRRNQNKNKVDTLLSRMGEIADRLAAVLSEGGEITSLIDESGRLLELLGVVGTFGREVSDRFRQEGYAVKVSGAGGWKKGVGTLLVYGDDYRQADRRAESLGLTGFQVRIGGRQ